MQRNRTTPRRGRIRSPRVAAALAVAGVAALGVAVPQAQAQSGRRICVYAYKQYVQDGVDGSLARYSVGLNYKKDGACPAITGDMIPTYYPHGTDIATGSIRKETCEVWGRDHSLDRLKSPVLTNADPCPIMVDDHVYVFEWTSPTTPEAADPKVIDIGPYWEYQW